jgi:xanthine dehydrogenase accessory factor
MDSLDLQVLGQARDWFREGQPVWLVTVIET